jgi:hypothetical protein
MYSFNNIHMKAAVLVATLSLTGCSGISVSQDYDRETDFLAMQSYAWRQAPVTEATEESPMTPLIAERIRNAIVRELGARNMSLNETSPDFLIEYHLSVESRISSTPVTTTVGFGMGHYGRYGGVGFSTAPDIRQYDEGTLVIDFYLADTDRMVWRGLASQVVDKHEKPQKVTEQINAAVKKMLDQFPPKVDLNNEASGEGSNSD